LSKSLNLVESEELTAKAEKRIKQEIQYIRNVYIHIEDKKSDENWNDITKESEKLIKKIEKQISDYIIKDSCHNFTILERKGYYNISLHCRLDRNMEIDSAHSVITALENNIKSISSNISEVIVHVEPG
jgi:divalent metal cation (Fe/Co/Zn/Cd) transporter